MSKVKSITPLPPADFTPERGNYTPLKPFRYWCQKVLPLVYDDSLSYYELLCKVVDFLNKTMEDVETLNKDVTSIYGSFSELQDYVNNYFANLDVQEEINNKLDEMAKSGELDDIVSNIFGELKNNISNLQTQINTLTSRINQLETTPGSTSGDVALNDIKIGWDSTNYNSPGDAVRTQSKTAYMKGMNFAGVLYVDPPSISRSDRTITFKSNTLIYSKYKQYVIQNDTVVNLIPQSTSTTSVILFDVNTNNIYAVQQTNIPENTLVIALINIPTSTANKVWVYNLNEYTCDGLYYNYGKTTLNTGLLLTLTPIEINGNTRTLTIKAPFQVNIDTKYYSSNEDVTLNLISSSITTTTLIFFNIKTNTFSARQYFGGDGLVKDQEILLLIVNLNTPGTVVNTAPTIPYKLNGVEHTLYTPKQIGSLVYEGEKFNQLNSYSFTKMFSISYSGSDFTLNDIDYIDTNTIVCGINPNTIRIINAENGNTINEYTVEGIGHCGAISYGKFKYNDTDLYNLMYFSDTNNGISIVSISSSGASIVGKIGENLSSIVGEEYDCWIDHDNNILYAIGFNSDKTLCEWVKYRININSNNIMELDEMISKNTINYFGVNQGRYCLNGYTYMGVANTGSPYNPYLLKFNTDGVIVGRMYLKNTIGDFEIEGVCLTPDRNICITGYYDFTKIDVQ